MATIANRQQSPSVPPETAQFVFGGEIDGFKEHFFTVQDTFSRCTRSYRTLLCVQIHRPASEDLG